MITIYPVFLTEFRGRMSKSIFIFKKKTVLIILVMTAAVVVCDRTNSYIKLGSANLKMGDYKRARRYFNAVIDKQPSNYTARLGLGKALLQEISVHSEDSILILDCLTQLNAARSLRPDKEVEELLSVVWFKRATALLGFHDTLAAMSALSRSISFDSKAGKPVNLAGIIYFHRGDKEKAMNLFRLVTTIDSSSPHGFFNIGMLYWAERNYTLAYEFWYKAAKRAPEDREVLKWTAMAKKKIGAVSP
jgi:tetratricopeptide (TPR) repeat protein